MREKGREAGGQPLLRQPLLRRTSRTPTGGDSGSACQPQQPHLPPFRPNSLSDLVPPPSVSRVKPHSTWKATTAAAVLPYGAGSGSRGPGSQLNTPTCPPPFPAKTRRTKGYNRQRELWSSGGVGFSGG
ncbi:hypothetical protein L1987_20086 [Smallanthus sonchifolius]|uniref:Uncharacterized protein n=1 Tax=Smallanthus sonchifolius TaxID=185202 RepID=A0ACB9IRN2_9ASTR|nr:hypothetical protein L1987_20086 [Smallanthus sonchifolius]